MKDKTDWFLVVGDSAVTCSQESQSVVPVRWSGGKLRNIQGMAFFQI